MNKLFCSKELSRLALLIAVIFSIGILANSAALAAIKATEKKSVNKIGWNHSFLERRNSSLNLVAAKKSPQLLTSSSEALLGIADQCQTASQINFGQSVNGQLTSTDCLLPDGSYADFYIFTGTQGEQITITMNSAAVDSYLGLASESGSLQIEDDDSGGGLNSKIVATLPETGLYVILANSALPNQFGDYTLLATALPRCTFTLTPTEADVPGNGGNFSFVVNTQSHCRWTAAALDSFITTSSSGTGNGTISYAVSANGTGFSRTGWISVGGQFFKVTQPTTCTYTLSPSSVNVPATQTTGSFTVNTQAGCYWSAQSGAYTTINVNSGQGTGTVNYSVQHNNGAARVDRIRVGGQTFTINQAGLNCTFLISPKRIIVSRRENTGTITVSTQPGCVWSATPSNNFIELTNAFGTGTKTINYRIQANPEDRERSVAVSFFGTGESGVWIDQIKYPTVNRFDYDTDNKADIAVFRPSSGTWFLRYSTTYNNQYDSQSFGQANDLLVPADYDGDGKMDVAVFRPSNGNWYWLNSSTNTISSAQFGMNGDVPVPANYSGDSKTDLAVYRPSNGTWYTLDLANNQFKSQQWGAVNDKPVVGDYDGDGKSDYAVYRPENGTWYLLQSTAGFKSQQWGESTDKLVPSDYDGDGKTDIAVWRPSNGNWYLLKSRDGFASQQFGAPTDQVAPADYDGDGRSDFAVFRAETGMWYLQQSANGFAFQQFGQANDRAISNSFAQ